MKYIKGLKCKECGHHYGSDSRYICDECFGPVELETDLDSAKGDGLSWKGLAEALIPVSESSFSSKSPTPLVKAANLGKRIGIDNLYLKDEGACWPSLSFKDRVVASALSSVLDEGMAFIACASTGNLANALAAHVANAGIKSIIFVPRDIDYGKIAPAIACGAQVFEVQGNYDMANRLCSEVHEALGWPIVNGSLKPYYLEGAKGIAYEILDIFKESPNISIICPIGGGGLLTALWKAVKEVESLGMIERKLPSLFGAQAAGCAPVINAIQSEDNEIRPVMPDTAVGAIAIGDPPDGCYALKAIKDSGGSGECASDEESSRMVQLLAEAEGITTGLTGGVALAAATKLVERNQLDDSRPVVVLLPDRGISSATIDKKMMQERIVKVSPDLESFMKVWKGILGK